MQDIKSLQDSLNQQFDNFAKVYQLLITAIHQLPFGDSDKAIIQEHFVLGYLWTKEAINLLFIKQVQQQNMDKKEQETKPEEQKEPEKPSEEIPA